MRDAYRKLWLTTWAAMTLPCEYVRDKLRVPSEDEQDFFGGLQTVIDQASRGVRLIDELVALVK